MAFTGGIRYKWRYGEDRDDRASQMLAGAGPGHPIPGIPPPIGPPGQAFINGVQFDGFIEKETPATARRNFLRVRSQRNADCESYILWREPRWKIYRVDLNASLTNAVNCNCEDSQKGSICKHMRLIDKYLPQRIIAIPRRSLRARVTPQRFGFAGEDVIATAFVGAESGRHKKKPDGYLCARTPSYKSTYKDHGHIQFEITRKTPPRETETCRQAEKTKTQTQLSDLF